MTLFRVMALLALALFVTNPAARAQDASSGLQKPGKICMDTASYALCTSAKCIPDPLPFEEKEEAARNGEESPAYKTAIWTCEVTTGPNFGLATPCEERQPKVQKKAGVTHVVSLYSFNQAPTKPVMACASGKPWTDCLDKPCVVDPSDPLKAICSCDIKWEAAFVTYGGDCNTLTCDSAYWSAACRTRSSTARRNSWARPAFRRARSASARPWKR